MQLTSFGPSSYNLIAETIYHHQWN